jgi:chromate transport protein ChrA
MYGLSLGVSNIGEDLHPAVFAMLSGLNSATVGIIALAAVQLSENAITDRLTRLIVFFTGAAGMLYTALWYFPVLMISGGLSTFIWDFQYLQSAVKTLQRHNLLPQRRAATADAEANGSPEPVNIPERVVTTSHSTQTGRQSPSLRSGRGATPRLSSSQNSEEVVETTVASTDSNAHITPSNLRAVALSWKQGACLVAAFLVSFVTVMILRGVLKAPPLGFSLFANLYLAGTIIFGGGPVVIPLLREYVVAEGWVSPRDFLLGLAVIQAFPGPNFNFAVYLGSLTMIGVTRSQSFLGALLGFVAIFLPGIWIVTGVMGVWRVLRTRRWLLALLRGINAAAVGLVYTAIYNLFKIGLVTAANGQGASLGNDPWWVAVTAGAYVGGKYFGVPAPAAIIAGGIAGLIRFGVVDA